MKNYKISSFLIAVLTLSFATVSIAQYDDLYYNPSDDNSSTISSSYDEYETEEYDEYDYDSEEYDEYEYYDDYDYQYTSRIRRFNRPYRGFDYYDPIYTEAYYYNRAFTPGVSIYVGSPFSYNRYRRWNRVNRFNGFNPFFNPVVGYSYGGFNGINNSFNRNGFGGFNSFNRGGFGGFNSFNRVGGFGGGQAVAQVLLLQEEARLTKVL